MRNDRLKEACVTALDRALIMAGASLFTIASAQAQQAPTPPVPALADAQQVPEGGIEDIVVTANKRSENIQKVPITITAVTADTLTRLGVVNTTDLGTVVPGLSLQSSQSGVTAHLRGIGTTAISQGTENSVATYVDGVYILSLTGALAQLNSIDQIDVLKGPQGTLFGRNATGGVISIRTRDPREQLAGDFSIRYGNYDTISGQGYLTGKIADGVSADIAGFYSNQSKGYGKNLFNNQDVNRMEQFAVRSKWLAEIGERDTLRLIGDFSKSQGSTFDSFRPVEGSVVNYGPGSTLAGARPDLIPYLGPTLAPFAVVGNPYTFNGGFHDVAMPLQPRFMFKSGGASLQWDHEFDFARVTSITAYREASSTAAWAFGPVPAPVQLAAWSTKDSQFSQELQLGSLPSSPVQWVAGLYYLSGKAAYPSFAITGTAQAPVESVNFHAFTSTKSGAAFGQATVPLWTGAHVTAGLRYTIERRGIEGDTVLTFLPPFGIPPLTTGITDAKRTFRKLTWRLSVDQEITPTALIFASYNRGFKSGVYNSIPPGGLDAQAVQPEVVDAFEVGLKTDLFDRHLRFNVSGFFYKYSNLQVTVFNGATAILQNGAKAEIYGLELEAVAKPTRGLTLNAGMTLMHSAFKSFDNAQFFIPQPASAGGGTMAVIGDARGNRLTYAPDLTFNVGGNYTTPIGEGSLNVAANYSYSSRWYASPDNILSQPAYGLMDASVTYTFPGDQIELGLWGRNLTNENYYMFLASGANPGGYQSGIAAAPRTYGAMLRYKF